MDVIFDVGIIPPDPIGIVYGEVTFNWSTMLYPENPDRPPLPSLDPNTEEGWIVRGEPIVFGWDPQTTVIPETHYERSIIIPDYNPEWVSIDVREYNFELSGTLIHECIPEPAMLSLLGLGASLPLLRRRTYVPPGGRQR